MTRTDHSPPGPGDWLRIRRAQRPVMWAYSAGALVAADVANVLPEGKAAGAALFTALTAALARELVHRDQ